MQLPIHLNPKQLEFPDPNLALTDPNGLLAIGGDLSTPRLLQAYRQGIFPWYSGDQPILWWSPDPRTILVPTDIHISRSLKKRLRTSHWRLSFDENFLGVLKACAAPRLHQPGTWIVPAMQSAYRQLFAAGYAHSVEVWNEKELIGGLYGIAIGKAFFGESMFSKQADASKVALVRLAQQLQAFGFHLIDCQFATEHLASMGAKSIARCDYLNLLKTAIQDDSNHKWVFTE